MRPHRRSRRLCFARLRHPSCTSPRLPLPFPGIDPHSLPVATSAIFASLALSRALPLHSQPSDPSLPSSPPSPLISSLSPHLLPLPSSPPSPVCPHPTLSRSPGMADMSWEAWCRVC
ncbi:unnamed protein product [Closterium sp. NIES-54]